jgi:hypothetical protein
MVEQKHGPSLRFPQKSSLTQQAEAKHSEPFGKKASPDEIRAERAIERRNDGRSPESKFSQKP